MVSAGSVPAISASNSSGYTPPTLVQVKPPDPTDTGVKVALGILGVGALGFGIYMVKRQLDSAAAATKKAADDVAAATAAQQAAAAAQQAAAVQAASQTPPPAPSSMHTKRKKHGPRFSGSTLPVAQQAVGALNNLGNLSGGLLGGGLLGSSLGG